jgi:hypothetical protein
LEAFLATTPLASIGATQTAGTLTAFAQGDSVPQPETLGNAQLAVLTVVSQTVEWLHFVAEHSYVDIVV